MNITRLADIIGYTAAGIGIFIFLPQAYKCWHAKQTQNISLLSYTLLAIGSFLWVIYGILMSAVPIIFVNTVGFIVSLFIIFLKRRYG